jgi:hypothetical protein
VCVLSKLPTKGKSMQSVSNAVSAIKSAVHVPIVLSGFANLGPYVSKDSIAMLHCPMQTYSQLVAITTRNDPDEKLKVAKSGRSRSSLSECAEEEIIEFMDRPMLSIAVSSIGAALSHKCEIVKTHFHVHVTATFKSRVESKLISDPTLIKEELEFKFKDSDDLLRRRAKSYHGIDKLFRKEPVLVLDVTGQDKTSEEYAKQLLFMIADHIAVNNQQLKAA